MQKQFIIFLFVFISIQVFGQPPVGPRGERPPMPDAKIRAERFTKRMTKELSLDANTTKKVHSISLISMKKMDVVFASKSAEKDKKAALDANKKVLEKNMKSILTPVQYTKFLKLQNERPGLPPPPPSGDRPPTPR